MGSPLHSLLQLSIPPSIFGPQFFLSTVHSKPTHTTDQISLPCQRSSKSQFLNLHEHVKYCLLTSPLPPRKYSRYSFLLEAESTSTLECGRKDYVKENSNDTIGNRTRNLPDCSAVPQLTAPLAACPAQLTIFNTIKSPHGSRLPFNMDDHTARYNSSHFGKVKRSRLRNKCG
jgi:hypothetical protein